MGAGQDDDVINNWRLVDMGLGLVVRHSGTPIQAGLCSTHRVWQPTSTHVSTRPFRLRPPSTGSALLRRRVQRELQARFDARVTVVRAGAGFGKSTALAQAVEQNLLAPIGIDFWLACEPPDIEADYLAAGLRAAVGLPTEGSIREIGFVMASKAPTQVCLIIDDSHEIAAGSMGANLLDELIASLPANGHVLLATRHEPTVSLARLDAQRSVHWIDDRTLTLSPSEVSVLAEREGVDPDHVADLGGWPALVSLALRSRDARDFMAEEVVSWLSDDQRKALAVVVAIGGADHRLLEALIGVEARIVLSDLPLVLEVDGWFEAHDLWRDRLSDALTAAQQADHQNQAVELLLSWSEPERAVNLCLASDRTDTLVSALEAAILTVNPPHPAVLRQWLGTLPETTLRLPAADFLRGLVTRADAAGSEQSLDQFERAVAGFRAIGAGAGEVEALAQVGYVHHIRRDETALAAVGARLVELAVAGEPRAKPYAKVAGAFVALSAGDLVTMDAALSQIETGSLTPQFDAIADWLRTQAQNMAGYPSIEAADRCVASNLPIPGLADVQLGARWHVGDFDFLTDEARWSEVPDGDRDHFLRHVWRSGIAAAMGRVPAAERDLDSARARMDATPTEATKITIALLELHLAAERDRSTDVGSWLDAVVAENPVRPSNRFIYSSIRGLIARYRPELWEYWADVEQGPLVRRDRDIGRALAAIDNNDDLSLVEELSWPEHDGELIPAAFLSGACLLVVAAWAVDRAEANRATCWLMHTVGEPARRHFRDLVRHRSPAITKAAGEILAKVAVPPGRPLGVRLLGPPELFHGADASGHGDWRRDNVRALLGYLVMNSPVTRDRTMAALWPEADEVSARRSIRSTLNMLIGVLEPERVAGEAAFFVQSEGSVLRLGSGDHFKVDVWDFEHHLDAAAALMADGVAQLAIDPLRKAVDLYRGDLAVDLFHEWLIPDRDRLRMRFVGAASTLAGLLAAEGELAEALRAAELALSCDPWSEAAHRGAIQAHLSDGDRGAATRVAKRCVVDLEAVGGAQDIETISLLSELLASGPTDR